MATGVEIANAYVALTVKAPNIKRDVESELRKIDGSGAGEKLGDDLGKGISNKQAAIAGAVGGIFASVANLAAGAIGNLVGEAVAASDATQKFAQTLSFAGLDTSAIDGAMSKAREYADRTVYDLGTIQNTTAQLAANGIENYSELTEAAGNLNAVAGGNNETFSSVAMMLTQTAGAGKLTTENWNQLADAIPGASGRLQTALADAGAYTGNFRDAMAAGEITADEFNAALLQLGTEPVAQEAASSVATMEGAVGNLSAAVTGVLSDAFTTIKPVLTGFTTILADFISNSDVFIPVISGLAVALLVALAPAIWAAVTATWAFTAALLANPFTWIVIGIAALVAAIVWVATQTTFFQDVWETVSTAIATAATWLWENVLSPVFTAIGEIFTWIWENVISPIGTLIVNYFRFWGAVAVWLWENVLTPVFAGIGQVFSWIWSTVIEPIVGFISLALQGLGIVFDWLYKNVIKPVWDGISNTISTVWNWIDQNVFTPFKVGIDLIGKAFEGTADAIGTAWDGIKAAAATPINFVLDTVWNNGLRSFWNDLVGTLGLNDMKLPKADLVKFASGGVLPGYTPGRDVHQFWSPTAGGLALSGGEAIMRPEFTRLVGGPAGVDALNAAARRGEIGDGFGDFVGDVWDNVQKAASVAWEFLSNPAAAIQTHVVDGIIKPLMSGQNIFGQTVGALAANTVKSMADLFAAAPSAPGGKGMGWQAMWNTVRGRFPDATLNSALRPGAQTVNGGQSYHALGRAIDLPPRMDIFNWLKAAYPNSSELIFSPAGNRQLLNGKEHLWGGAVRAQHFNHVHWAMANGGVIPKLYDQGGWLPHGGIAMNMSGRPEPVLTDDQWAAIGKGGEQAAVIVHGDMVTQDVPSLFREADKYRRRKLARTVVQMGTT